MVIASVKTIGAAKGKKYRKIAAETFIGKYYKSIQGYGSAAHQARWQIVEAEIKKKRTYKMTLPELVFGARESWNIVIGGQTPQHLQVFDARSAKTAKEMFSAVCRHLAYATGEINTRSAMTVFGMGSRIWNYSIVANACDEEHLEFTKAARSLGWKQKGQGTERDILPIVVQAAGGEAQFFDLPEDILEQIRPDFDDSWVKNNGLYWYEQPGVSQLMLDCGGLQYPIAFNGWKPAEDQAHAEDNEDSDGDSTSSDGPPNSPQSSSQASISQADLIGVEIDVRTPPNSPQSSSQASISQASISQADLIHGVEIEVGTPPHSPQSSDLESQPEQFVRHPEGEEEIIDERGGCNQGLRELRYRRPIAGRGRVHERTAPSADTITCAICAIWFAFLTAVAIAILALYLQ